MPECAICAGSIYTVGQTAGGEYVKCRGCGLETLVVDDAAAKFAAAQADYFHDDALLKSSVIMDARRVAAERRFAKIKPFLRQGRLLEIGPGGGHFLALARQEGMDAEGVDEAPGMAKQAQDFSGARVHVGELENVRFGEPYDNIVSIHVIEHVPDPVAHMRAARHAATHGAVCVVITPNVNGWEHRLMGSSSPSYSTAHLNLFTAEALGRTLQEAGWGVFKTKTIEHPSEWLRVLRRVSGRQPIGRGSGNSGAGKKAIKLMRLFGSISAPFRSAQEAMSGGNEVAVFARAL